MVSEEDISGEPASEEEGWMIYDKTYLEDPFIRHMSMKFKSNLKHSELALQESLLHLYMDGMVEVRMNGEAEPAVRLTDDGGNIMVAQLTATFGTIAEA